MRALGIYRDTLVASAGWILVGLINGLELECFPILVPHLPWRHADAADTVNEYCLTRCYTVKSENVSVATRSVWK